MAEAARRTQTSPIGQKHHSVSIQAGHQNTIGGGNQIQDRVQPGSTGSLPHSGRLSTDGDSDRQEEEDVFGLAAATSDSMKINIINKHNLMIPTTEAAGRQSQVKPTQKIEEVEESKEQTITVKETSSSIGKQSISAKK